MGTNFAPSMPFQKFFTVTVPVIVISMRGLRQAYPRGFKILLFLCQILNQTVSISFGSGVIFEGSIKHTDFYHTLVGIENLLSQSKFSTVATDYIKRRKN